VRRPVYLALGIVALVVIGYLVFWWWPGSRGNNREAPGSEAGRVAWQTVTADGFKVEMPTGTDQIEVPAFSASGAQEPVNMIEASLDPATTYAVTWADNPPVERASGESADKTLDTARDGALARSQTALITESRATRLGFPARDFAGRNENGGILNARLILAGTRLYMLIAAFPSTSARHDDDVRHFFDSFQLTSGTAAP